MSTVVEDKHTKSVNGLILFILSVKSDYPECYMDTYHFLLSKWCEIVQFSSPTY